ncbi:hypothetical protein CkaCkLH20_10197 [Colletotrichum karsti]|uniref:Ankyrin repeat protein n=1 Tax=Colletotrichum karsti TaxID=1095194 RepID=A0A9P6LH89_9PEZI|nr:uncharacterized protein CkaCkLH20_10197 [Colletotrichum karsti]KAF9872370.1 hypothetical protein CkaCkLH20_10197 [Colletotrichum karsti]
MEILVSFGLVPDDRSPSFNRPKGSVMDASLDRGWREALVKAQAKTSQTYQKIASKCYRADAGTGLEQLRDILSTLRLLLGTINSLSLLVMELRIQGSDSHLRGPQPDHNVLDTMSDLLEYLNRPNLEYPIDNRIPRKLHAISDTLRTAAASHDCFGMETCLITYDPPMSLFEYCPKSTPDDSKEGGRETEESSHEDAMACLAEVMRVPKELEAPKDLLSYQSHVAWRDLAYPRYSISAWRLPELVKKHWDSAIKAHVENLFSPDKPAPFEYWLLEYATRQWPERFDTTKALSKTHFKRLMSMVSDPSLRPLHVAAALGLNAFYEDRVADQVELRQLSTASPFGTPLYCALLGPNALLAHVDDPIQLAADFLHTAGQKETIAKICLMTHNLRPYLGAYPSQLSVIGPNPDEPVSLTTLAFLVCHSLDDPELFNLILTFNPALDDRFLQLFLGKNSIANYWPSTLPELSLSFLHKVLPSIIDYTAVRYTGPGLVSSLLKGVYEVVGHFRLESITPTTKLPNLPDDTYYDLVREIVPDDDLLFLRRFVCDPRWKPDIPLVRDDSFPAPTDDISKVKTTTLLHYAVECNMWASVSLMLSSSASVDINVRNENDQTPLMLSESPEMFKLLKCHGARTTETDHLGRNIWHIAAANADVNLIDCLMENDENKDQNLRGLMHGGQTPIAQSIIYPLQLLREGSEVTETSPVGALHLLKSCKKDPAYLQSPTPLILLAAQWGSTPLVTSLLDFGADPNSVDEKGQSALHYINISAAQDLVTALQKVCKTSATNHSGLTPAETIFDDLPPQLRPRYPGVDDAIIESEGLDDKAYQLLLTPEVLSSRNDKGHGLWERFAARLADPENPIWDDPSIAGASMKTATSMLIMSGAMHSYEKEKREPGLLAVMKTLSPNLTKIFFTEYSEWAFDLLISTSKEKEKFKTSAYSVKLLKLVVIQRRTSFVRRLLELGVSVHLRDNSNVDLIEGGPAWTWEEATSALEYACEYIPCENEIFDILLSYVDTDKLNEDRPVGQGFIDRLIRGSRREQDFKLRKLLRKGLNPNPKSGVNGSPAMVACIKGGHLSTTLSLLDHGGDVSATDESGMDAPLAAAWMGSVEILDGLKASRPDMDLKTTCTARLATCIPGWLDQEMVLRGCTGLHLAAFKGHVAVFDFLIKRHGFDVNVVTSDDRWTPLHCAAYGGQASCVRSLLELGADTTAEDCRGHTPMAVAIILRRSEIVCALLWFGSGEDENPTVHRLAQESGCQDIIDLLTPTEPSTPSPSVPDVEMEV